MEYDLLEYSLQERFEHLLKLISSERFLKMESLNGEVPFFICPFKDRSEYKEIEGIQARLGNRLEQFGISVLQINLFDLAIELLQKRGRLETLMDRESQLSKDKLLEFFQSVVDPEAHLVPAITKKMAEKRFDVMFVGGVGEVYPYIRSHNVLNNLQSAAKDKPTVLFFPGEYKYSLEDGASLDLFGRLHDDKYYRAFNIYRCEV